MASRQPTDSPPRKKTKFKCRHCKCPFNTSRGLAVHQNGCAVVPEIRNIHPNNYTAAEFNRDLSSGYVNPHQYRPGLAHNLQLRNIRPIGGQDPPGFHVDDVEFECTQQREDVDPSNTISGIQHLDVGEAKMMMMILHSKMKTVNQNMRQTITWVQTSCLKVIYHPHSRTYQ
jgi:hypothetical protein